MRSTEGLFGTGAGPASRIGSTARAVLFVAVSALLPLAQAPAAAASEAAKAVSFIDGLGKDALATLQQPSMTPAQREAAFGRVLRRGFEIDHIARFVLGDHWHKATAMQRADYLDAFGGFVVTTYAHRLQSFAGQGFAITGTAEIGEQGDILVETRIDQGGGQAVVAGWRVREIEGAPKIIDVVVEGVSMAMTQRHEFAAVVRRGGVEGLVQILRAQTAKLSTAAG